VKYAGLDDGNPLPHGQVRQHVVGQVTSSHAYPTGEQLTPGAWPLTANARGSILDVDEDAPCSPRWGTGAGAVSTKVPFPLTSDPGGSKLRP
jgi:hypothetical protein